MLLLKFPQLKSTFGWSVPNLAAMPRMNLLTYRDPWVWLGDPYHTPRRQPPVADDGATGAFLKVLDSRTGGPERGIRPCPSKNRILTGI